MIIDLPPGTNIFDNSSGEHFEFGVKSKGESAIVLETQEWIYGAVYVWEKTYYGIQWIRATKQATVYFELKKVKSILRKHQWQFWGTASAFDFTTFAAEGVSQNHKVLLADGRIGWTSPWWNL